LYQAQNKAYILGGRPLNTAKWIKTPCFYFYGPATSYKTGTIHRTNSLSYGV